MALKWFDVIPNNQIVTAKIQFAEISRRALAPVLARQTGR
jgi:hypothetical protein